MVKMYKALFDAVLTDSDFEKAIELKDAKLIAEQVITPRISKFIELTGQENDPRFLAYALIHTLGIFTNGH